MLARAIPGVGNLGPQRLPAGRIFFGWQDDDRRRVGNVAVHRLLRRIAEKGRELVELFLRDRVELVIVTRGAAHREPQPHRARGLHSILGVHRGDFFDDGSAFVRRGVAAVEAGGDLLFHRGIRKQIPGELLDGETVEGEIAVESLDHPVAVGPHLAVVVDVNAVRVGVARCVEPVAGAMFTVARRGEQAVDQLFIGVAGLVAEEGLDVGSRGWQSGQIERKAADEPASVGFRRGLEAGCFKFRQNECVDRIPRPLFCSHARRGGTHGGLERPVFFPSRALLDPALEHALLLIGEVLLGEDRRHAHRVFVAGDALIEQAGACVAGRDDAASRAHGKCALARIQPQSGHARIFVRPVTVEAVFREDGADLTLKVHRAGGLRCKGDKR